MSRNVASSFRSRSSTVSSKASKRYENTAETFDSDEDKDLFIEQHPNHLFQEKASKPHIKMINSSKNHKDVVRGQKKLKNQKKVAHEHVDSYC